MNALARLIRDRLESKGWSTYDVERAGGPPARTLSHLADPRVVWRQPPRPDTLNKLAKGLQLPRAAIEQAAIQACGYHQDHDGVATSPFIDEVAELMRPLSKVRQAQLADLVMQMIKTWPEVPGDEPVALRAVAEKGRRKDAKDADLLAAAERRKQAGK